MSGARCHIDAILSQYGKSRAELARVSGLNVSHVWKLCVGRKLPKLETIWLIQSALERMTGEWFDLPDLWTPAQKEQQRRAA